MFFSLFYFLFHFFMLFTILNKKQLWLRHWKLYVGMTLNKTPHFAFSWRCMWTITILEHFLHIGINEEMTREIVNVKGGSSIYPAPSHTSDRSCSNTERCRSARLFLRPRTEQSVMWLGRLPSCGHEAWPISGNEMRHSEDLYALMMICDFQLNVDLGQRRVH